MALPPEETPTLKLVEGVYLYVCPCGGIVEPTRQRVRDMKHYSCAECKKHFRRSTRSLGMPWVKL